MNGDSKFSDVLACSLYDTKPVKIISYMSNNFKYNTTTKKVYSKIEKKTMDMKFHRLNVIHMTNFEMVSVDIAYQRHV